MNARPVRPRTRARYGRSTGGFCCDRNDRSDLNTYEQRVLVTELSA